MQFNVRAAYCKTHLFDTVGAFWELYMRILRIKCHNAPKELGQWDSSIIYQKLRVYQVKLAKVNIFLVGLLDF